MTSHELARWLLANPDLPVATHANNHTDVHGPTHASLLETWRGPCVLIGNFDERVNDANKRLVRGLLP